MKTNEGNIDRIIRIVLALVIFGLGLAYAGSSREDVLEILVPLLVEEGQAMEVVALTTLTLGLVYCGTANEDLSVGFVGCVLQASVV